MSAAVSSQILSNTGMRPIQKHRHSTDIFFPASVLNEKVHIFLIFFLTYFSLNLFCSSG